MVTALVSHPDMVRIDHHDQGNTVLLEVHVDPEDMGKIIGKQGKRAQAIRAIMKAKATKCDKRVIVDIV
ncbi:MAG: KH domain-containing protein [Clostridia bacterium]|nr:KH domain-containing protein [Clostridia bacterium]